MSQALSDIQFFQPEFRKITTPDEFFDSTNLFSGFDRVSVRGSQMIIEDDGQITVNSDSKTPSEEALKNLCGMLKIPDPFAKRIPFDLLQENLHRLLALHNEPLIAYSSPTNGHWVNFGWERITEGDIPIVPVFEQILELLDQFKLAEGEISERGVSLNFLDGTLDPVKDNLAVGSFTKFGRDLTASESGFGAPSSKFFAYRLICSNGMVAPRLFGQVKARTRGENMQNRIRSFIHRCELNNDDLYSFALAYHEVSSRDDLIPNNKQFYHIWRAASKITGDVDYVDDLLRITEDRRSEIKKAIRHEKNMENLSLASFDEEDSLIEDPPPLTSVPWFELSANVTQGANNFVGPIRRKMQMLGGEILGFGARAIKAQEN